jgi:hypothetical protein
VLGEDYERKMAVVAVLKQYAEDRDLDILCGSLDAVLTTPQSRAILRYIRCVCVCVCVRACVRAC